MAIKATYHDGNPEDRAYRHDFWTWLGQQPLQAWLYYARTANWDQAESIFIEMVRQPRCDRGLASWLFWSANPAEPIAQGVRPGSGTLIGAILDRSEKGGFQDALLRYPRVEVAFAALQTAEALAKRDGPPPFRIPRALCASFDGGNPDLPPLDETTERDLERIFRNLGGKLPRSDGESLDWKRTGGNWWYEQALRLPPAPRAGAEMSDIAAIDAVFGEHRSSLARIEQARAGSRAARAAATPRAARPEAADRGLNPDPRQRRIGLALLAVSALALLALLAARFF